MAILYVRWGNVMASKRWFRLVVGLIVATGCGALGIWGYGVWQREQVRQRDAAERQKLAAYVSTTGTSGPGSRLLKDEILAVLNATTSGSDSSPERVRLLLAAMKTADGEITPAAESALLRLGPVIAPEVAAALSDQNLRKVAVRVLVDLEPGDWITAELVEQSVRPLLDLPRATTTGMLPGMVPYASDMHFDAAIRYDDTLSLKVFRRFGPLAVRPLLGMLEDTSCLKYTLPKGFTSSFNKVEVALNAIAPGWQESEDGIRVLGVLRERLTATERVERLNVIRTIALFGPAALPTLEQLVTDPDPATSTAAAEAFKQIRDE